MPNSVYVLRSKKDNFNYVGCTNNLKRRLVEHNNGKVFSTRDRRPFILIYAEYYLNQQDAFAREKYLKTSQGARLLKRMLKEYFYKQRQN